MTWIACSNVVPNLDKTNIMKFIESNSTHSALCICCFATRVILKVTSNFVLHANWEQQTKESVVVDGTSCCVILECFVTSVACIT